MKHCNIIVAHHNFLVCEGLTSAIQKMYPLFEIHIASQAIEIFHITNQFKIDLVFLDSRLSLLNNKEVIHLLKRAQRNIKIIGISISDDLNEIMNMINAGVDGYLMYITCPDEISQMIKAIIGGEKYFADCIKFLATNNQSKKINNYNSQNHKITLSEKERRILVLICRQYSNKEIAEILNICVKTVEMHRANLIQKTHAKNIVGCVLHAVETGIYKFSEGVVR